MSSPESVAEIITNTDTRAVVLTPEVEAALPGIDKAFAKVDRAFLEDPEKYLENLDASVFQFSPYYSGPDVTCSLIHGPSSKSDEAMVIFAPFSDRSPKSSASELYSFMMAFNHGVISKEKASPNSWNQTTKSAVIFELLRALGKDIPVLTIYSPIPVSAYREDNRELFKKGDFLPAGKLAHRALEEAQIRLNGIGTETNVDTAHLYGASLGASNAVGAAGWLSGRGLVRVPSVTAQELILGPKNLPDLGKRFTVSQHVGEPSDEAEPESRPKIEEPEIRKAIDGHGSEPIGTNVRVLKAMAKLAYMKGLTKPEKTVSLIEGLLDWDIDVLVALAENSSLTHQTRSYLPNDGETVVTIRGEKGQTIGHIVDEHVALTGLVAALNIVKPKR